MKYKREYARMEEFGLPEMEGGHITPWSECDATAHKNL